MSTPVVSAPSVRAPARAARRAGMWTLLKRPRALLRFLVDGKAPLLPRLFALLALVYIVMPIDAIPDFAPVIGWLDDLGVTAVAVAFLASQAAKYHNAQAEAALPPSPTTPAGG
jgi:uncharacterized membrane protein YkvA (DUF1232 family)